MYTYIIPVLFIDRWPQPQTRPPTQPGPNLVPEPSVCPGRVPACPPRPAALLLTYAHDAPEEYSNYMYVLVIYKCEV